jgi:GNAT superfamily N-acetyltransferase
MTSTELLKTTARVDGAALTIRPIEANDVERLARMFDRLSPTTVYYRFLAPVPRLPRSTLVRLADVDHCFRDALVALDGDEIIAVARYNAVMSTAPTRTRDAEIALTVEDAWQRRGIGRKLVRRLGALAAQRGFDTFVATIHPDNRAALGLLRQLVPDATVWFSSGEYQARLPLAGSQPAERCGEYRA